MTLAERARLATKVRMAKADKRAAELRRVLAEGECRKRAAYRVGISLRTFSRYMRRAA